MNKQDISEIVKRKPTKYLISSVAVLVGLFIGLLIFSSLSVQFIFSESKKASMNTPNTHIINTAFKLVEGTESISPLYFEDETKIKDLIKDVDGAYSYTAYVIPYGITDENDNVYSIRALSDDFFTSTDYKINDNEALTTEDAKDITLKVPVMDIGLEGDTSASTVDMKLSLTTTEKDNEFFSNFGDMPDQIIVNTETYAKIIELMYDVPWTEFKKDNSNMAAYGFEPIGRINTHVENSSDLNVLSERLAVNNYDSSYGVGDCGDTTAYLKHLLKLSSTVLIVAFAFVCIITRITFKKYMATTQKDIGILKNYGYSNKDVYAIYKSLVTRRAKMFVIFYSVFSLAMSYMVFKSSLLTPLIITIILIIITISVLSLILLNIIKKTCNTDTITLLNIQEAEINEFEKIKNVKQYDEGDDFEGFEE